MVLYDQCMNNLLRIFMFISCIFVVGPSLCTSCWAHLFLDILGPFVLRVRPLFSNSSISIRVLQSVMVPFFYENL